MIVLGVYLPAKSELLILVIKLEHIILAVVVDLCTEARAYPTTQPLPNISIAIVASQFLE